ncbi:MAG: (deoxy)nucleoside triphosphate pyrophosphohydrolase [Spirochaetes bacterium]|nr:(deoxy)nucleoside triphosphate pyrophosphohydrolase [Spirochaetota bacterium]
MAVSTAAVILKGRKILLAQRLPTGSMASRWEFPGGKVEMDETPEKALARELEEEFGITVQIHEPLCSTEFFHKDTRFTLIAFRVEMDKDPPLLTAHTQIGWYSPDEIEQLPLADSDRSLFEKLKPYFKSRFQVECNHSSE